jgi:hypothetical protein
MPPPALTPLSASTHFSLHSPIKLMTLRPNTWFALETLVEFVVVSYLIWALFYLIYLWVCGAVWTAKGLRDLVGRRKGGEKWRDERQLETTGRKVAGENEGQSGPAYKEKDKGTVEDASNEKSPIVIGTHEDDTRRGRRMTV